MTLLPDIDKIAVLRANALGDFIFALPALGALRLAYPEAEISLLGRPWHQEFLANRPGPIDRVIVIPDGGIGQEGDRPQDRAAVEQFYQAMQQEQFDLAIQMHGGGRNSNPFTKGLAARTTIGLCTPDAMRLDRWLPYVYFQSEIVRFLELVKLVGATNADLEPHLSVTAADLGESYRVVPVTEQPLAVLHPGASDARRHWPTEKFAALGDWLAARGYKVLVSGIAAEAPLVQGVIEQMTAKAESLCDRLTLNGFTGLLSRSALVITNDSGPLHLATAVGTPTIGIYWCGNLITAGQLYRTRHYPLISWCLHCPVCGVHCMYGYCDHRASFVAEVTVEQAIAAVQELGLD